MSDAPHTPATREQLLHLLAEAAEFEHNLLCCYLYAAFSLKGDGDAGLDAQERQAVARWRRAIVGVAVEEMAHLALVANLSVALGARAHFDRPNFPVSPGYHPAGIVVELAPFDADTLDHFVYLERPEAAELPDGHGFDPPDAPARGHRPGLGLMPGAVDYATTAGFYRHIRAALVELAERIGERRLFVGDPRRQVGPGVVALDGLREVTDLASALAAIDTIVVQGEGAPREHEESHFRQFASIRAEYGELVARRPGFRPAHPVARNPVMRKPADAAGRIHVDHPRATAMLDLANALYNAMLRMLAQAWGRSGGGNCGQKLLLDTALGLMHVCGAVASRLATLPAGTRAAGVNAGMSFTMLRATSPWLESDREAALLLERLHELEAGLAAVAAGDASLQPLVRQMTALVAAFARAAGAPGAAADR
jgi:hypothetical protein